MREDTQGTNTAAARLAQGAALQDVLAVADPGDWLALDAAVRDAAWWYRAQLMPEWKDGASSPGLPDDLARLGESRLALALCHRDGRIRERAIRSSARYPGLLPLIVIRCADWAEPVRTCARELLRTTLDMDQAVSLAPLIVSVGRRDRGGFGTDLLGTVLRQAPPGRLAALFVAPDRAVRRFVRRLAIEQRMLGPAELARAAARDEDAVIQDLCATAALAMLRDEDGGEDARDEAYDAVLTPLLAARNPRTRATGVTALRGAGRPVQAEPFLNDRSALVRACARYVVRQHGGDPTAGYRERCLAPDDPELPPGAVIGLAEGGDRADGELLWPLLAHPAAGVRAQAVAGLRALDLADAERLRPLLDDPVPAVVRETTTALLPSAGQLPADWLLERIEAQRPRHIRLAAFRLLDAYGGIVALRAAVGLMEDPDLKLRTWAGQSVQRWHPSAGVRPGDPEVGELLDRSRHLFSDYVLRRRKWEAGLAG
ncbi:HEAT repeat domain-containing protein [Streptomyces sp. NPDC052396]|uniref:HEAT repeat domain-containing protein n=1 Tax=Streptomyces sp. NPDC052396 TaxID=3365689 RepID=UPI0037CE4523